MNIIAVKSCKRNEIDDNSFGDVFNKLIPCVQGVFGKCFYVGTLFLMPETNEYLTRAVCMIDRNM